jgi:hypothetical protein
MCRTFCCLICGKEFEPRKMVDHVASAHLPFPAPLDDFVWFLHATAPGTLAALGEPAAALDDDQLHRYELNLLFNHEAAAIVKQALA